ncbi:hypothetical protein KIPB_011415, partial [Kipferlia bialata]
ALSLSDAIQTANELSAEIERARRRCQHTEDEIMEMKREMATLI